MFTVESCEKLVVLVQGYDDQESCVRKACVFGLVAIHMIDSDGLKPYLSDLTGSKVSNQSLKSDVCC